jgi:hypothetical protein
MTSPSATPVPASTAAGTGRHPRGVLAALCITEITSWGVLYYAFPVLAPAITAGTGWSTPVVTAAFSAALVVAALMGVPVGGFTSMDAGIGASRPRSRRPVSHKTRRPHLAGVQR